MAEHKDKSNTNHRLDASVRAKQRFSADKRPVNHLIEDQIVAYLLSYPRSGNSWTRYIIEYITGIVTIYDGHLRGVCPAPGLCDHVNADGPLRAPLFDEIGTLNTSHLDYPISSHPGIPWREKRMNYGAGMILKKHFDLEVEATTYWMAPGYTDKGAQLIFLLRDPRECIKRHDHNLTEGTFAPYMKNVLYYLDYPSPKQIIYYEDLRIFPEKTIRRFINFILYPKRPPSAIINKFMKDYHNHVELSAALYRSCGDGHYNTVTLNEPNHGIHHYHKGPGIQARNELLINVCNRNPEVAKVLRPYLIHARHQEKERGGPEKGHVKT